MPFPSFQYRSNSQAICPCFHSQLQACVPVIVEDCTTISFSRLCSVLALHTARNSFLDARAVTILYVEPKRRHTDSPVGRKDGVKLGPWRVNLSVDYNPPSKSGKSSRRASRSTVASKIDPRKSRDRGFFSPRTSRDQVKRVDLRKSRDHHSRPPSRSRGRDTSPKRSAHHHHRPCRKSSHIKELSRHRSHGDDSNLPPIPSLPSFSPMLQADKLTRNKPLLDDRLRHREAERLRFEKEK